MVILCLTPKMEGVYEMRSIEITDGRWSSTPTGAAADYKVRMLVLL